MRIYRCGWGKEKRKKRWPVVSGYVTGTGLAFVLLLLGNAHLARVTLHHGLSLEHTCMDEWAGEYM